MERIVFKCILIIIFLLSHFNYVHALINDLTPPDLDELLKPPKKRILYLKLPLEQPEFHWAFTDRKEFLSGKLVLTILRENTSEKIVIFEKGIIKDGWMEATEENMMIAHPQWIYFGFYSTQKYLTSAKDQISLELTVVKDVEGIGADYQGILKTGTYIAEGGLEVFGESANDPTAYTGRWKKQWRLEITQKQGWMKHEKNRTYSNERKQRVSEEVETEKILNSITESHYQAIEELLDIIGKEKLFQQEIKFFEQLLLDKLNLVEKARDDFETFEKIHQHLLGFLNKEFTWEKVKKIFIVIYAKHFNEAEIRSISQFYSSPTGIKLLEKKNEIELDSYRVIQKKKAELLPHLIKIVEQYDKK